MRGCMPASRLSHAEFRGTAFFPALDGVRGLSILGVLWHHTDNRWAGWPLYTRGFLGVDVFFVLSGFLIVTLLLRERDRAGQIDLKRFYIRRTLRIFPLFYAAIVLYFVSTRVFSWTSADPVEAFDKAVPYLILYVANWYTGPAHAMFFAWSLAAEEQFYLIWPPLERFFAGRLVPVLVLALAVNQAINFGLIGALWPSFEPLQARLEILQVTFTPMLLGIGLAYLLHERSTYERFAAWAGDGRVVGLLAVASILVPVEDLQGAPRLAFHLIATAGLAAVVIHPHAFIGRMLQWRPLCRLGQVSYGVYVLHMLVVFVSAGVLNRLGVREIPAALLIVATAGSWVAAEISYRVLEQPFLRLKRRFAASQGSASSA